MTEIAHDSLFATTYRDFIAESIAQEAESTLKVFVALPAGEWRPDPKARTAQELVWHIVSSDLWFYNAALTLDFTPPKEVKIPKSVKEMIALYKEGLAGTLDRMRQQKPELVLKVVDFYGSSLPVYKLLSLGLRHSIHHRGELVTYLRPLGGKVPAVYGDSADTEA